MIDSNLLFQGLGIVVVTAPFVLLMVLGGASLLGRPLGERAIGRCVVTAIVTGLLASVTILFMMLLIGTRNVPIALGSWVEIGHGPSEKPDKRSDSQRDVAVPRAAAQSGKAHAPASRAERVGEDPAVEVAPHYHFSVKFVFDRLSVPFVIMTFILCGTIGAFANRYMHRERGFNRFFVFFALFVLGMVVTSLAGTIETLFVGWELVGLSSALLIAFFHERPAPVKNGLRVWAVYRISDAALLMASVAMHHLAGEGDFHQFLGTGNWPEGIRALTQHNLTTHQAFAMGLLFLLAAAGKSALVPFSGWLPRAMEGPTPSSAVFYGALSVHLGAFLLLRVNPIFDLSLWLCVAVITIGLISSAFAAFAGRVQTDIKSALSFASLTQVGIIVAEVGLASLLTIIFNSPLIGDMIRYFALVHILGHACLRTLQFLRAPTLLHDYSQMENAIGSHLPRFSGVGVGLISPGLRSWFYRLALERGYLDSWLSDYLVGPFLHLLHRCDAVERKWTDTLAGCPSRESERPKSAASSLQDLI